MGTLTSYSFVPLNSEFRSNPVRRAFRESIHYHRLNRLSATSQLSKWDWGKRKHINFDRFRCFSINNNGNNKEGVDGEGEIGNNDSKSNVTTALPDEDRGFNSEKSTNTSTSQRVHVILF